MGLALRAIHEDVGPECEGVHKAHSLERSLHSLQISPVDQDIDVHRRADGGGTIDVAAAGVP